MWMDFEKKKEIALSIIQLNLWMIAVILVAHSAATRSRVMEMTAIIIMLTKVTGYVVEWFTHLKIQRYDGEYVIAFMEEQMQKPTAPPLTVEERNDIK